MQRSHYSYSYVLKEAHGNTWGVPILGDHDEAGHPFYKVLLRIPGSGPRLLECDFMV